MKMSPKFYCLIIFTLINVGYISSKSITTSELFVGRYPIPSKTPDSINIISSQIKRDVLLPITFVFSPTKILQLVNTGKSIELRAKFLDDIAFVTGGPFGTDLYNFHLIKIYWTKNSTGPAGTTVNGVGAPVLIQAYFYNIKYGTFENALQHRDGIAQINHEATIGATLGVSFVSMANALKRVRKAHSKTDITVFSALIWFEYLLLFEPYYTYPGTFTDDKGETYECTTVVMYPPRFPPIISPQQYKETFLALEDEDGKPYSNALPPQPSTTPVVQSVVTFQIVAL